ncbi:MAG TPA: sirohydrochlorin chelatase [Acidimicrobiales bacterium]|nr:sirohydrochlorin chelatase [Acidimicrobiales bacterium]
MSTEDLASRAARRPIPPDGLLLVGHGSRSPAGRAEMLSIGRLVSSSAPYLAVEVGFLELCDPPAPVALDRLAERGVARASLVPLVLNAAGHAKSDAPAVLLGGRQRHHGIDLRYARPLGVDHTLVSMAADSVAALGALGLPLAMLARGSSDPDANSDAFKAARLLAEVTGAPLVEVGFSGITWPSVPEALESLRRKGANRLVCVPWFLCTGVLVERLASDCVAFARRTGVQVLVAPTSAPDPNL